MSRRRDPKSESLVPDATDVAVVCTGRGRHTRVSFGKVTIVPGNDHPLVNLRAEKHFVDMPEPDWSDPDAVNAALEAGVHTTYTLECRRCRPARRVPLTQDSLAALARGLTDADMPQLDISALGAAGAILN